MGTAIEGGGRYCVTCADRDTKGESGGNKRKQSKGMQFIMKCSGRYQQLINVWN